jgi:hypothetical protein
VELILYSPEDPESMPPHKLVRDALETSLSEAEILSVERKHEACLRGELLGTRDENSWAESCTGKADCPQHRLSYCAACDWTKPAVRKRRQEKKARLEAFRRSGKFPPGWLMPKGPAGRIPKMLSDKEARKVVLPDYFKTRSILEYAPEDRILERAAERYLELMGFERRNEHPLTGVVEWSCGCETCPPSGRVRKVCERHHKPLQDGAEAD